MSLSKNPKVRKFVRDKLSLVWTTLTNEEREQIIRELDKQLNDKKAKRGEGENSKLLAKFVKANEKQLEKKLNEGKAVIEDEVDVDEEIEDEEPNA
jgi:predicted Fe-S protein YdhL (DUF1289 family)